MVSVFSSDSTFLASSLAQVKAQTSDAGVATAVVTQLKDIALEQLDAHQFAGWLESMQGYLTTALKVEATRADAVQLLRGECATRTSKQDILISQLGAFDGHRVTKIPQLRALLEARRDFDYYGFRNQSGFRTYDPSTPPLCCYTPIHPGATFEYQRDTRDPVSTSVADVLTRKSHLELLDLGDPLAYYAVFSRMLKTRPCCSQVASKEGADALVKYLVETCHTAWPHSSAVCDYKAAAAALLVRALKIDPDSLFIYSAGSSSALDHYFGEASMQPKPEYQNFKWNYHTALGVTSSSGEKWILDPMLKPDDALSIEDWTQLIHAENCIRSDTPHQKSNEFYCHDAMKAQGGMRELFQNSLSKILGQIHAIERRLLSNAPEEASAHASSTC